MTDWQPIQVEYITGSCSYQELAEKYGVNFHSLKARGKREKWSVQRQAHRAKVRQAAVEKIAGKQEQLLEQVDLLADRLLDALERAVAQLDRHCSQTVREREYDARQGTLLREVVRREDRLSEEMTLVDRRGLQQLAAVLKVIQQIKMLCTDRDSNNRIEVVLSAGPEEWNL